MKKIGLVEDNPDNRLLIQAMLEGLYEVEEYEDGQEALTGFAQNKPDLVLMDISLPGMDGYDVLQRMREDPQLKALPVVALTAHAMVGDREKYLAMGFDEYLAKPIVDADILTAIIAKLLK